MSKNMIKEMVLLISLSNKRGTQQFYRQAEVVLVEGNTSWVNIPGTVDETPVRMTMNDKTGETIQVRASGGRACLAGNASLLLIILGLLSKGYSF